METGLASETAGEEGEVAVAVEVEEVGVAEPGQAVGTRQGLRWETGGPVVGWENVPSGPALARLGKLAGLWELEQAGEEVEEEWVGMLLHWSVEQ